MPKQTKTQFDFIAIGGATWDVIVDDKEAAIVEDAGRKYIGFPYGDKVHLDQTFFGFGGGGSNVAVSASRLGMKVAFVGAVGSVKIGEVITENLQQENVDISMVKKDPEHRSGVSIVLLAPDGERTILLYRGANSFLTHADIDWDNCKSTKWIYISSLSGESDKLYNLVAETARKNGSHLAINPGNTQIRRGTKGLHSAMKGCALLILNKEEARELLRQRGRAGETVREMLVDLQKLTGGIVAITKGAEGADATDGESYYRIPAFTDQRLNNLGAGDAFGSTLAVSLAKELGLGEALKYATINASAVVNDYGAQSGLLSWDELSRRVKDAPFFQGDD